MDARERVESQIRRPSIKRPWDEDPVPPENVGIWPGRGLSLPPIDIASYRRPSLTLTAEDEGNARTRYGSEMRESGGSAKKPRYEQHDYNSLSRENLDLNGRILQTQASGRKTCKSMYTTPRSSQELPSFPPQQHAERWGRHIGDLGEAAGARESSSLCQRCRRLTTPLQEQDFVESCEVCCSEEVKLITLAAAKSLSQLQLKLLRKGNFGLRDSAQRDLISADCPPIEQFGLKHTLNWLLGAIYQINDLADQFVQHVASDISQSHDRDIIKSGTGTQDVLVDIMKRHIEAESDNPSRSVNDAIDPVSDARLHARRKSVASNLTNNEDFSSVRSPHDYHGGHSSLDAQSQRASIMNPPPAPNRQLPSPPGRSLPSPTSINFPSPSAGSYGSSSNPMSLPPPSGLHQSSLNAYLPPIGSTHSPDALQAHSAALQHEVSVQKIALASLQGEHNKLLAAFSRSQTRASALEKKHQVSDTEIISLTEEKLRLQSQVTDLEKDVEQLARSRDEYRQSAVQEGAQYVEMIKKASRLEEMADEERKAWAVLKAEMEQRIESLTTRNDQGNSTTLAIPLRRSLEDSATPPSSIEGQSILKAEPATETHSTSYPVPSQESDIELKEEIRRLRSRCAEAEEALRAVRDDSRNMEGIVQALGLAGKSIMERADRTLGNVPRIDEA
ncbi:uncharacterized protein LY89DRAFT_609265 [Mollisia scopiformis]|uniref:Uncharacterized protein n=1 Tax=Mollisia scopiformis TaxID=149040 RepID=A0A194XLG2_MOLSC|nr:uncharacterized protein LY89DRAFT_609265 [Mollisia scopiformis]KUJ20971.1 hypothetical protein LY89DRAFT_609265 [Mollisia scopiformis]